MASVIDHLLLLHSAFSTCDLLPFCGTCRQGAPQALMLNRMMMFGFCSNRASAPSSQFLDYGGRSSEGVVLPGPRHPGITNVSPSGPEYPTGPRSMNRRSFGDSGGGASVLAHRQEFFEWQDILGAALAAARRILNGLLTVWWIRDVSRRGVWADLVACSRHQALPIKEAPHRHRPFQWQLLEFCRT